MALSELIDRDYLDKKFCVIDLDCCSNLNEIIDIISIWEAYNGRGIFLMGSKGIYSELFSCFDVIDANLSIDIICRILNKGEGLSSVQLRKYILSCRSLEMLTVSQVRICLLDRNMLINSAPDIVGLNISSVYRHINNASRALNFKSIINFRCFISKEFTDTELAVLL
jgi:hypothetical protein